MFHTDTEYCVFCRFLSEGTDNTNCGHPCEKHRVSVRNADGREHPVMADVGCRNTVFGAEAQVDPNVLEKWRSHGISNFRLEFVHQTPQQVVGIATAFYGFLHQELSLSQFEQALRNHSPQQTTTGSLFVPKEFKQLVQLT